MRKQLLAALLGVGGAWLSAGAGAVELDRFLREDAFNSIKI